MEQEFYQFDIFINPLVLDEIKWPLVFSRKGIRIIDGVILAAFTSAGIFFFLNRRIFSGIVVFIYIMIYVLLMLRRANRFKNAVLKARNEVNDGENSTYKLTFLNHGVKYEDMGTSNVYEISYVHMDKIVHGKKHMILMTKARTFVPIERSNFSTKEELEQFGEFLKRKSPQLKGKVR